MIEKESEGFQLSFAMRSSQPRRERMGSQPTAISPRWPLAQRPNTGWADDDVVAGRQSARRFAGNGIARRRDGLAAEVRAGNAGRRLSCRRCRMMVTGRMGWAVLGWGRDRVRCKSGRQTKQCERENNSSQETLPSNSFRYQQPRGARKVSPRMIAAESARQPR